MPMEFRSMRRCNIPNQAINNVQHGLKASLQYAAVIRNKDHPRTWLKVSGVKGLLWMQGQHLTLGFGSAFTQQHSLTRLNVLLLSSETAGV